MLEELELQADVNGYVALISSVVFRYDSDPPSTFVRSYFASDRMDS